MSLGVDYAYRCTADGEQPWEVCEQEAITPIEIDGSMYCEDHMEQSDASRYLKKGA